VHGRQKPPVLYPKNRQGNWENLRAGSYLLGSYSALTQGVRLGHNLSLSLHIYICIYIHTSDEMPTFASTLASATGLDDSYF